MHAFPYPSLLDECTGRSVPSLYTHVFTLRFYDNLSFPRLRMAHDDTSLRLEILDIFNFLWTLVS